MPSIFIVWKQVSGKYVPETMYACNKCGTKYSTEQEATDCEALPGVPKFRPGDKVMLKYDDGEPVMKHLDVDDQIKDYIIKVKEVKAVKGPDWSGKHWFNYVGELPGGRIIEVHEREIKKA